MAFSFIVASTVLDGGQQLAESRLYSRRMARTPLGNYNSQIALCGRVSTGLDKPSFLLDFDWTLLRSLPAAPDRLMVLHPGFASFVPTLLKVDEILLLLSLIRRILFSSCGSI